MNEKTISFNTKTKNASHSIESAGLLVDVWIEATALQAAGEHDVVDVLQSVMYVCDAA